MMAAIRSLPFIQVATLIAIYQGKNTSSAIDEIVRQSPSNRRRTLRTLIEKRLIKRDKNNALSLMPEVHQAIDLAMNPMNQPTVIVLCE